MEYLNALVPSRMIKKQLLIANKNSNRGNSQESLFMVINKFVIRLILA